MKRYDFNLFLKQARVGAEWMTIVKKLLNESGHFEETVKFNWEPMELFVNRRCLCVFVPVCDNPIKCVLNTMWLVHVETGQTPKERVALIKVTGHQGTGCQDSSLISQVL